MASIRGAAYVLLPRRPQAQSRITLHTRSATLSHSYPASRARGPQRRRLAREVAGARSASVSGRIRMAKRSRLCSSVAGCGWRNWCVPQASGPAAGRSAPGALLASIKQAVPLHSARACAVRSRCTRKKKRDRSRKPSAQPAARPAAPRKQDARSWQNRRLLSSAGSSGRNEKCHFSRAPWSKKRY